MQCWADGPQHYQYHSWRKDGHLFVQSNSGSFLIHEPTKTFIGQVLCGVLALGSVLLLMLRQECLWPDQGKPFRQWCLEMGLFRSQLKSNDISWRVIIPLWSELLGMCTGSWSWTFAELDVRGGDQSVKGSWRSKWSFSSWERSQASVSSLWCDRFWPVCLVRPRWPPIFRWQHSTWHIRQILAEFGVSGSDGPPIDIRTDAATDVGEFLRCSATNREFTVSRAGPRSTMLLVLRNKVWGKLPSQYLRLDDLWNSFAHFVVAMVENELKYFQAKSLKLVLPLVFPPDLIQRFVISTRDGVPRKIEDRSPVEVVPSDFMKLPGRVPPPKSWVDAEGKTPGCKACDSLSCMPDKVFEVVGVTSCLWIEGSCTIASRSWACFAWWSTGGCWWGGFVFAYTSWVSGEGAAVAQDWEKRRKVQEESSPDPFYARWCPACESGMNVPGIRHNAECKRKRASLEAQSSSVRPEVSVPASAPAAPEVPAIADSPQEDFSWLDHPMFDSPPAEEDEVIPMELSGWMWSPLLMMVAKVNSSFANMCFWENSWKALKHTKALMKVEERVMTTVQSAEGP